jgi:hypothetical protein
MRSTMLMLPLICLAGCMSDSGRTASAPSQPATPTAPAAAVPVAAAIRTAPAPVTVDLTKCIPPSESPANFGYDENLGRLFLLSNGAITLPLKLAGDGDYSIVISADCDEAQGQKAKFSVTFDDQVLAAEVSCTTVAVNEYVVKAPGLKSGDHKLAIAFLNDAYKENEYDLNLYIHGVSLKPSK